MSVESTARSSNDDKATVSDCYRFLGLKRSKASRHMPSAYVFPGGAVDRADFSPKWLEVFRRRGSSWLADIELLTTRTAEPRPSTLLPSKYAEWTSESDDGVSRTLPPEAALRLTAIRETFEECGILLARSNSRSASSLDSSVIETRLGSEDLVSWQRRVKREPLELANLCMELNCCPDVWSLHEWSDWLTPITLANRFDTLFFICEVAGEPTIRFDSDEIGGHKWNSPEQFLELFRRRCIYLPPPQIYELTRLGILIEAGFLKRFFAQSTHPSIPFMYPVVAAAKDGVLFLFPGDELYPENPHLVSGDDGSVPEFTDRTLDELMLSSRRLHRAFSTDANEFTLVCNLKGDSESNSRELHFVSRL